MLPIVGWLLLGGLGAGLVATFWDEIREWALETAASWVERHIGRRAAGWLREAIVVFDRILSPLQRFVRRTLFARVRGEKRRTVVTEEEVPVEDLPKDVAKSLRKGRVEQVYEVTT